MNVKKKVIYVFDEKELCSLLGITEYNEIDNVFWSFSHKKLEIEVV